MSGSPFKSCENFVKEGRDDIENGLNRTSGLTFDLASKGVENDCL